MNMDFVNPILEILIRLWDCITNDVKRIHDFDANLKALENALDQLKNISEDVKTRVQLEEERQMLRKKQVDSWLKNVEVIDKDVNDFLDKARRRPTFGCPSRCCSSYKLVENVEKLLKAVEELKTQGSFDPVADILPRGAVDERPLGDTVGLNTSFQELQRWIDDSRVKVIGIYGMGGVGKTTLLKKMNNEFVKTNYGFELVIWVVVSKQSNLETVQDGICEKLKLPESTWKNKSEDEKAVQIFRFLRLKKFVLLLDDVWRRVDLVKVGVPTSDDQRMFKVIFTTRYEDVCGYMEANKKIKIECLARDEALMLFRKKVGLSTINAHPSIEKLSEIVAQECKGLPLALITVGRAMANKIDPRDWDKAIARLKKEPSRIMGMDDEVFHILKFSYDSLNDNLIKSCFIYCCIYPEDHDISIEDLLELWIGEGFLDEFDDIHEARDRGREIVECLKGASLLENGKSEDYVKMHDVIRDMALRISSGSKATANKFLVLNRVGLIELDLVSSHMKIERISLWSSSINSITEIRTCPNVSTFLARYTAIRTFPSGFVQFMPVVKVLDLSFNFHLSELPSGINKLVELEFLNLSNTRIRELPIELKNLTKMKYLLLNATHQLQKIPCQVISSFSFLRVFKISGSGFTSTNDSSDDNVLSSGGKYLLEELESLEYINDVCITILDANSVRKLLSSRKILNCLSSLCFEGLTSLELSSSSVERMRHLERLDIYYCKLQQLIIHNSGNYPVPLMENGYFHNLRSVYIAYCDNLLDLTWLIYAPTLELLDIAHCASMVEIVKDLSNPAAGVEPDLSIFSRLKILRLINLPSLISIYPHALPFPSLVKIHVGSCLSLRRLPFDSNSGKRSLKEIKAAVWWWIMLRWDDATLEPLFRSHYVPEGPIW